MHTTNSDGELAPRALARHYGRAGYDVVALTDHWHRSEAPSSPELVVLPGVELNCLLPEERDGHVLGIGIERDPTELEGERRDLAATGDWIVGAGGVAYLAHPYWTGARSGAIELPPSITGIEVFNAGCELEVGRGLSSVHWDELLQAGRICPALVTDDSHHPGFDSDHAWTWIRAERNRESILDALRTGRFYGSTGPLIHDVETTDAGVVVRCTPARSVTLLMGRDERFRGERGSAGLPVRRRRSSRCRPTAGSSLHGSTCSRRRRSRDSRSSTRPGTARGRTRCGRASGGRAAGRRTRVARAHARSTCSSSAGA